MLENAEKFFALYREDAALRKRVAEAEAAYPFTVKDLRAYETRLKMRNLQPDEAISEDEPVDDDPVSYWLLDRGWENDPKYFKK